MPDTRLALGVWQQPGVPARPAADRCYRLQRQDDDEDMIACILQAAFSDAVLATQGNLNNDIGLPLTLLKLRAHHKAAIVEMGMNHPGEIGYLTRIARPTVALVTNAQRAHLEGWARWKRWRAKGSIYDGLGSDGVALVNADDPQAGLWRSMNAGRRVVSFRP